MNPVGYQKQGIISLPLLVDLRSDAGRGSSFLTTTDKVLLPVIKL